MVTGLKGGANMTANALGTQVTIKDATSKSDRRSNKPIMEKRRRARINNCLNELKTLILDATKKDPARHSKLEKADILEKTVKHLQELQRQQTALSQAADPKIINKFKAGFTDCANEVSRFPGLEPNVKRRLLQHLSTCINGVRSELHQHQRNSAAQQAQNLHTHMLPSPPSSPEQDQQMPHVVAASASMSPLAATAAVAASQIQSTPNDFFLPNGLQVIPTKLPNGSIALVLPQSLSPQQQHQQQHSTLQPPLLVPIPSRTASTSSASSHTSSSYERTLSSPLSNSIHYAPPSPANSYENVDAHAHHHHRSVIHHASLVALHQQQQQHQQQHHHLNHHQMQQPLSLVVKKHIRDVQDEQPWRPW